MESLSERETAILRFESEPARGFKPDRIRAEFGLHPASYYLILNRLIDDPRALAAEPMLVHRLQRVRRQRMTERLGRTA